MSSHLKNIKALCDYFSQQNQTAQADLFQRITIVIDEIKSNLFELGQDEKIEVTESVDRPYEIFRSQLIKSIQNDSHLIQLVTSSNIQSFVHDCTKIYWEEVTKNFHSSTLPIVKTVEFFVRLFSLIDPHEKKLVEQATNSDIWCFTNICTFFEYEMDDLLSLYTACRITENLLGETKTDIYTRLLDDKTSSRSQVREKLFTCMFHRLWRRLCRAVGREQENPQFWIEQYTIISNYFPFENVLSRATVSYMRDRIDFMHFVYLIFLHSQVTRPLLLIRPLFTLTSIYEDKNYGKLSICLQKLPNILIEILEFCQRQRIPESTLMIDIQQWIIRVLKSSQRSPQPEILKLLRILSNTKNSLSLPIKQYLFEELCIILIDIMHKNQVNINEPASSFWSRICLLPTLISCTDYEKIGEYELPYHPSVTPRMNENHVLLDLYFFYLRRLSQESLNRIDLIQQIIISKLPDEIDPRYRTMTEKVFQRLKDYFILQLMATLLCEMDSNAQNQDQLDTTLKNIIDRYLTIDIRTVKLSKNLEFFLSLIISKKSWNFLTDLLKSPRFQRLNANWANTLGNLLLIDPKKQAKRSLRPCHQVRFAAHIDNGASIFPTLHKSYQDLQKLIHQCIQNRDLSQRWVPLIKWIQPILTSRTLATDRLLVEIKVMLLLITYYNYYCKNQLDLLVGFFTVIEKYLRLSCEELIVFRAFLQPRECMVGYTNRDDDPERNFLNDLFHLNCEDEDELPMRHTLVNLLAMILLGGKQNFLWSFAFEPTTLLDTYGFGSLRSEAISVIVHYDCGCFLTETGELVFPPLGRGQGSLLNIPAIYVAYFATFGAMAWHMLLYKNSPETFYGPILAKHAIDSKNPAEGMNGGSLRARVAHFIRARIVSTNFFLAQKSSQDDTCILLTRCFEQLAALSRESGKNPWIKPVFKTHEERYVAEQGFQDLVFYPMYKKVAENARFIASLDLQSVIQKNLQEYISQLPMIVQFEHFKTELCNPKYSHLPLTILRHALESFDYLRTTKCIYDLSRFHLLLHQTFSRLIEKDELFTISLNELYERSRKHFARLQQASQSEKHWAIIQNGINAVNGYHQFSGGQIRPGACGDTKGFQTISIKTPVNYLIETDNSDEGNIIMRILSILISFHNHFIDTLDRERADNTRSVMWNPALKKLIQSLSEREVSILQIAQYNTGVITVDTNERRRIEQIAQASLQNQMHYYFRSDSSLSFDYAAIQYYVIHTYLLHCRIKHDHLQGKYQYFIKKNCSNIINCDPKLVVEWSHLEQLSPHRLQQELTFLQSIQQMTKTLADKDLQSMSLFDLVHESHHGRQFREEYGKWEIQDFSLGSIDDICQLYENAIDSYKSLFIGLPQGMRQSLERNIEEEFDQNLRKSFLSSTEQIEADVLNKRLQDLTAFINTLKTLDAIFDKQFKESFRETCEILCLDSNYYEMIPHGVKGKNYVPVCEKFIELRSELYEKIFSMKKKKVGRKNTLYNTQYQEPPVDPSFISKPSVSSGRAEIVADLSEEKLINSSETARDDSMTIITMSMSPALSPLSKLWVIIREKTSKMKSRQPETRFKMLMNGCEIAKVMIEREKLHNKFREIFDDQSINPMHWAIIDTDSLSIDFSNDNKIGIVVEEYRVVERATLIPVKISFEDVSAEYHGTSETNLSSICSLFFLDHQSILQQSTKDFQFIDQYGKLLLDDCQIECLDRSNGQELIHIRVVSCELKSDAVCEVVVKKNHDDSINNVIFSPSATWKQIIWWLQSKGCIRKPEQLYRYHLWWTNNQTQVDENQLLASASTQSALSTVDIDIIYGPSDIDLKQKSIPKSVLMAANNRGNSVDNESLYQSLAHYDSIYHHSTQLKIILYDDLAKPEIVTLTKSRSAYTVRHLLKIMNRENGHYCIASTSTKVIFDEETSLDAIKENQFYLVRDFQTCSVTIQETGSTKSTSNDRLILSQRYIMDATLNHVYPQNLENTADYFLQYDYDFVLSGETKLGMLVGLPQTSLVLNRIKNKLPVTVTITCEEQDNPIKVQCLPSITNGRIRELVGKLWALAQNDYALISISSCEIDDDVSLREAYESINIQLVVVLLGEEKCTVKYSDRSIAIPIRKNTIGSFVLEEAIKKFHIPQNERLSWKLYVLDDTKLPTEMDLEQPVVNAYKYLSKDKKLIPLQLKRNKRELRK